MLSLFTLDYVKKYVLTTQPIAAIQPHAAGAVKEFAIAFYAMTVSLFKILYCLLLIVVKLSILAFPHAVKAFHQVAKFHRQLSWSEILLEFLTLSILLIVMLFYKRIINWWKKVERYISAKSKAAAAAAPHVLFFTGALIFAVLGKKFILPFTSPAMMPLFTLGIPALRSFQFVRSLYNDENQSQRKKYYPLLVQLLTLWVVLGTYHSIVTVLALIPFSGKILLYLPFLKELVIVVLLWIQLSPMFTKIVFTSVISPVITYLSKYIPTAQNGNPTDRNSQYLVMILRMTRFFHEHHLDFVGKLLDDSVVTIMATIFICIPNPFATMGMMTIACLLPAFRVVSVAAAFRLRGVGEKNTDVALPTYLVDKALFWLYYWIVFGCMWLWRIYVTPIWPSVTIVITLWLQHIFFAGGKYLVVNAIEATNIMIQRNKQHPISRAIEIENREGSSINLAELEPTESEDRVNYETNVEVLETICTEEEKSSNELNISPSTRRQRRGQPSPSIENPSTLLLGEDTIEFVPRGGEEEEDVTSSEAKIAAAVRRRNRLS